MSDRRKSVEQCLFGYDDGHRLLASSIPLGTEAATLTELSDLAPGAVFGRSESYWTGVPAPSISRYVLMRTWPAPEMSRPGCVWTHALLFEPSLFEELGDLSALRSLLVRPSGAYDRERYGGSLPIPFSTGDGSNWRTNAALGLVGALLGSLYGTAGGIVTVNEPGDLDDPLFAVWSQQWPRLRRNFRFQTAATREARPTGGVRFDVTAMLGGAGAGPAPLPEAGAPWLLAAASDALGPTDGDLRSFLWRYGADVRKQRGSFVPLVEVKLLHDAPESDVGSRVLGVVTKSFPDLEDASHLKQELVNGELASTAQLEVLWYVLAQGGGAVFPPPTEAGVSRLALLWPVRPDDLLHMAETTADNAEPLGRAVFETITSAVPIGDFWRLTSPYPRVRRRMVDARPELLLSAELSTLDNNTVATLVPLVPPGSRIAGELVSRLLSRDDSALAETVIDRFPLEVASQVVAAADEGAVEVGRAWRKGLVRRPETLLDPAVMKQITRTSLLHELADALGWLTPDVVAAGTEPWLAALVDIRSDLDDEERDILRSFLLALALSTGGDGGRRMLEQFFEAVHDQVTRSRLPWRAREILSPLLPQIGWDWGWDFGLRLRMGVSIAYVRYDYPPTSFAMLARGKKARAMMADAAREVEGGKPLARAMED